LADPNLFSPSQTLEDAITKLRSIRGMGEWTAQYIAMRVLGEPDAFPAGSGSEYYRVYVARLCGM